MLSRKAGLYRLGLKILMSTPMGIIFICDRSEIFFTTCRVALLLVVHILERFTANFFSRETNKLFLKEKTSPPWADSIKGTPVKKLYNATKNP